MIRFWFILTITAFVLGCEDDDLGDIWAFDSEEFVRYNDFIDSMDLFIDCQNVEDSYFYLTANINGQSFCVYDTGQFQFSSGISSTTPGPVLILPQSGYDSTAYRWLNLKFPVRLPYEQERYKYPPFFGIGLPTAHPDRDYLDHLDSIFMIKHHEIGSKDDVVPPPDASIEEQGFHRAGYRPNSKPKISFGTRRYKEGSNFGYYIFSVKSIFGQQDNDSYLHINRAKKTEVGDEVWYELDMSFACKLYHHPKYYFDDPLWANVTDGRIICKVKVSGF